MQRTNVYLDDDQLRALRLLAAEEGQSVAKLVRVAVDQLLVGKLAAQANWGRRLDQLVTRIQARVPASTTSDETEADITAARAEVKRSRRAGRH